MDRKEFEDKIKEIGTCDDEVKRRELLTSLNDEVGNIFDDNSTLRDENTKQKNDIERLTESNRNYFMRLETQKSEKKKQDEMAGDEGEKKPEPRKFENLFDEKGGIK